MMSANTIPDDQMSTFSLYALEPKLNYFLKFILPKRISGALNLRF